MESEVPLLSDQKYEKALKLIGEIRADRAGGRNTKADAKMVRLFSANKKPTTDSVVLSGLIRLSHSYYPERYTEIRDAMLEADSGYTAGPIMTAADLSVDDGEPDTAILLMSRIQKIDDIGRYNYIQGRIRQLKGDQEGARKYYLESFKVDPYNLSLYSCLHSVDPDFGWGFVGEIMSYRQGVEPTPARGAEGIMQELSAIYTGWIRGDRTNSKTALLASQAYTDGNPFYMTVLAWMHVSDGYYRKAVRSYMDAIDGFGGNVRFLTEMADIQDRMGESEDSETACRKALDLDPYNGPATAQLAVSEIHRGRIRDAVTTIEGMMKLPNIDAKECARCIDALWSAGRHTESNSISRRTIPRCSDEAYALYLTARNNNRNGNFSAARRAADSGMKKDPDSVPCICQYAIALSGMGKVDDALQTIKSKLPVFMDDIRLLDTEKEILTAHGDYDSAIEVCDQILDMDPRNADVMRDKANAYRLKGDYEQAVSCYRESLNIREDLRLFISVLKMLLDSQRTEDLCRLVDDFDDTYGSNALVWRLRGNAEYEAEMYDAAIVSFSKASTIVTNDLGIWHSKGMAEEKAGLYADAEASYDRAVILDLENEDCWISKATVQELQGNVTGAIDSLNRVVSVSSDNVYALAMKGRLLAKLGRYRESIYFLKLAYALDTSNTSILEMILKVLVREGETKEAIHVGRKVLERDSSSYQTMIILAEIYTQTGSREEALLMLNDAIGFIGNDKNNSIRTARAYHELMCYNEEIDIYESLLAQFPDDRELLMSLAEAYSAAGEKDAAAATYERLEKLNPEDSSIAVKKVMASVDLPESEAAEDSASLMDTAKRLVDEGKTADALRILRNLLDTSPEDPELYLYTAQVMDRAGMYGESIEVMDRAKAMMPNDARILYFSGTIKDRHGDASGALSDYNDAARLGMANHDLFFAMGRLRLGMGMLSPAIDVLQDALREDPTDEEARTMLCDALMRAGREADALPHIRTLLNSDPYDVKALRLYVTAAQTAGGTESVLSVYDNILKAERTPEDTEFFRQVLIKIGEYSKADLLLPDEPEPFDADEAALKVLDTAYTEGTEINDPSVYEDMELGPEEKEQVLDLLTMQVEYEPSFGSRTFDEMESMSNQVIVSEKMDSIELIRIVPMQLIRHATACASIEKMHALQRHIELSFSLEGVNDAYADAVDDIVSEMEPDSNMTLYNIMKEYNLGIMTARMVLNRISEINNG